MRERLLLLCSIKLRPWPDHAPSTLCEIEEQFKLTFEL